MPIPGTVPVTALIAPTDPLDTFPTHDEQYGLGGYRVAATETVRNLITADRRRSGMLVYTKDTRKFWRLDDDLTTWIREFIAPIQPVANVTALRALSALTLTECLNWELLGYYTAGDGGGGLLCVDLADVASAEDGGAIFVVNGVRIKAVFSDGVVDVRRFGAKADGVTSATVRIQAAIDYLATTADLRGSSGTSEIHSPGDINYGPQMVGGVLYFPNGTSYLLTDPDGDGVCLKARLGVFLTGPQMPANMGYPRNPSSPRFIRAPMTRGDMIRFENYTLNELGQTARFGGIANLIFDGSYDDQVPSWFNNHCIHMVGFSIKNLTISGIACYDNVGYDFFADPVAFGSSTFQHFYGSAYLNCSDLQISHCEFNGRTRGSSPSGCPFPALWMDRFSIKNHLSDIFLFSGPREAAGSSNSQVAFGIANYSSPNITLTSNVGIYNGMPVLWNTNGTYPTGIDPTVTYMVLWTSDLTIQLCSSATWLTTKTPITFTGGVLSGDSLTMGTPHAPLMLLSGLANTGWNTFAQIRLEDNHGDLLELRGSQNESFNQVVATFAYLAGARYLRLSHGAVGNVFVGCQFTYDGVAGHPQPTYLAEFSANSFANVIRASRFYGAAVSVDPLAYNGVLDLNVNVPANTIDWGVQTEILRHKGNNFTTQYVDMDQATTLVMTHAGGALLIHRDVNYATLANHTFNLDVASRQLSIVSETASPQFKAIGYSQAPGIALNLASGTRANPGYPTADTVLGFFGAGGWDTVLTAAKGVLSLLAGSTWTASNYETYMLFSLTPSGTTAYVERLRLSSTGDLKVTGTAPVIVVNATNGASGIQLQSAAAASSLLRVKDNAGSIKVWVNAAGFTSLGTGAAPVAGAALQLGGTTGALCPPPMTKAQRNALTPVEGGIIFQTDNTPGLRVYENGAWVKYGATADP